jgi:hypothetical protein
LVVPIMAAIGEKTGKTGKERPEKKMRIQKSAFW